MDPQKVAMLAVASGMVDLPPHLEALADDDAWWERLEATPESELDAEQLEMFAALGVWLEG